MSGNTEGIGHGNQFLAPKHEDFGHNPLQHY